MPSPGRQSADERLEAMVGAHEVLAEVSRSLGPALELEATVASVLGAMRRLVSFRGGSVCLVEDHLIRIVAADPSPSEEVLAARLPVGKGLAGRCVSSADVVYSPDLDTDVRVLPELRALGSNAGITSFLAVPLICLGRVVGLLQVDSPDHDAFDEVDRTLLRGLGAQVASAIESARQIEEMQRLERQKQAFISMVSHELRTPLTIAKGMVETLIDAGDNLDAEGKAFMLDRTDVALVRLEGLVEELILMSQLASDDLQPTRREVALLPLLERIAAASIAPHDVTVECPPEVTLSTDEHLFGRAVAAMVDNALKYAGDATVTATVSGVSVRDHGAGIPADMVGRELEQFTRSGTNKTTTAGLGLGFTMASTLASVLGGHLGIAAATDGPGTVVTIDLSGVHA